MIQIAGSCSLQWAGLRGDTVILMSPVCLGLTVLFTLAVEEGFLQWMVIADGQTQNWLSR